MGQKKLIRFAEIETFPNVLQFPKDMQGKWHSFFKNNHPIVLELACGKGEYAVGLGKLYPQKNFIGVDMKGNRLWVGAKKALANNLTNVAFMRTQIDHIASYFAEGEISEIWITFPDPQLRTSKAKKRLTHPKFLRQYHKILTPGGSLHLKTDSPLLFQFTKMAIGQYHGTILQEIDNIHNVDPLPHDLAIKTHYESQDIAQSNRIHYLQFTLPQLFPTIEKDATFKELIVETENGIEEKH